MYSVLFISRKAKIWRKNSCVVNVPFTNTTRKKSLKASLSVAVFFCGACFSFPFFRRLCIQMSEEMEVLFAWKKNLQFFTNKQTPIDFDLYQHSMTYTRENQNGEPNFKLFNFNSQFITVQGFGDMNIPWWYFHQPGSVSYIYFAREEGIKFGSPL